ncbi:MAG: hypothetical protein LUI12_05530 [Clostridiales bacterium]|nr:hypothetical protein [Clostridiales bacterium]
MTDMPWCPKCRNEYREGITLCAECGVELVDSLEEKREEDEGTASEAPIPPVIPVPVERAVLYQNSAAKAEDNRSSAYTLLVVGGIGFLFVLLIFFGVLPIYQNAGMTKYLVSGVMGAMFILFIVFGVVSMRSSKVLFGKAQTENSLITEMTKWCQENLSAAQVDEGLFEGEELAEEQKYFMRAEKMKNLISDKFLNLDEAFLDHFIDEYYQTLFEEPQ